MRLVIGLSLCLFVACPDAPTGIDAPPQWSWLRPRLCDGPIVGIAGTDAHQDALCLPLRDDERIDSYRRALSWLSNDVIATDTQPAGIKAALAAGRSNVVVLTNGKVWATGCGAHPTDGPGAYRVQVNIAPQHLEPFLGDAPQPFLRPSPQALSNAIRVHE